MNDGLKDRDRERIFAVLSQFPKVTQATLFGSRAIGTFRPASDIDLVLDGAEITLADIIAMKAKLSELNLAVDIDLIAHASISNSALREHIENCGIPWYRRKD